MQHALYKDIAAELAQIAELKWVDWNFGQLTETQEQYPIPLPAVLITFGDFSFNDLPSRVQEGEATIHLDLYVRRAGDAQAGSPKQEKVIKQLVLLDEISSRLHAEWYTDRIQALHRRAESPIATPSDLIGVRQTYEARLVDTHMQEPRDVRKLRLTPRAVNARKTTN